MSQIEVKKTLIRHYDYLGKIQAIRFIKEIDPSTPINTIIRAYNCAYRD